MDAMRTALGLPARKYQSAMMRADTCIAAGHAAAPEVPGAADKGLPGIEPSTGNVCADSADDGLEGSGASGYRFAIDADDVSTLAPDSSVTHAFVRPPH
jgi:hypothetical protein